MLMRNFLPQNSLYLHLRCVNLTSDLAKTRGFRILWNFHISPPFSWRVFTLKSLVSLANDPGSRRLRYDAEYHSYGAKAVEHQTPLFSSNCTCISITEFLNEINLCVLLTAYISLTFTEPYIDRCVFYITKEMQLIQCSLTLRLLMSYIYWAPSKARNVNVVYIWTYVCQRWNSLFLFAAQYFNTESMQRGFLCHICV